MDATPLNKIAQWLEDARTGSGQRNPLAMALATSATDGRPGVRMVLAKDFDPTTAALTFYTHFQSRKGYELDATGHAAAVFYWEAFGGRQLRIEGPVTRVTDAVADQYFATRPAASQLNAWVSEQSQPITDANLLSARMTARAAEFGIDAAQLQDLAPAPVPRPPHWGGYQIQVEQVEFWSEGAGRFHERLLYRRSRSNGPLDDSDAWQMTRLQP